MFRPIGLEFHRYLDGETRMNYLSKVRLCFTLLDKSDKNKLLLVAVFSLAFSFLDLLAIGLVGLLGALSVSGIQGVQSTTLISRILTWFNLEGESLQSQVSVLGAFAGATLLLKTLASSYLSYKVSLFLSLRSARISSNLIKGYFRSGIEQINQYTTQKSIYALTQGVSFITLGVIGACLSLFSEISFLLIVIVTLLIVNPILALGTIIYFGSIAFLLYLIVQRKVDKLARAEAVNSIKSQEMIAEARGFYKELVVKGREQYYVVELTKSRFTLSRTQAKLAFFPNIPKYFVEVALVVGAIMLAATTLFLYDAQKSVATLAIFLVSALRIAPAILRMQSGFASIRQNLASSSITLDMYKEIGSAKESEESPRPFRSVHSGFVPTIEIANLKFYYSDESDFELSVRHLKFAESKHFGIAGTSGSGKSTLINLILGVLNPKEGKILVSSLEPKEAIHKWPGAIAYVPQDVFISTGSIIENVCLGFDPDSIPIDDILRVIEVCQLSELLSKIHGGLNGLLEERGSNISGGQRQRLGIARALITRPKILILDESTSALDEETKKKVINGIFEYCPGVTLISVSHDPSLLKTCHEVIRVHNGKIKLA